MAIGKFNAGRKPCHGIVSHLGEVEILLLLEISAGTMGHLAHMQTSGTFTYTLSK